MYISRTFLNERAVQRMTCVRNKLLPFNTYLYRRKDWTVSLRIVMSISFLIIIEVRHESLEPNKFLWQTMFSNNLPGWWMLKARDITAQKYSVSTFYIIRCRLHWSGFYSPLLSTLYLSTTDGRYTPRFLLFLKMKQNFLRLPCVLYQMDTNYMYFT